MAAAGGNRLLAEAQSAGRGRLAQMVLGPRGRNLLLAGAFSKSAAESWTAVYAGRRRRDAQRRRALLRT